MLAILFACPPIAASAEVVGPQSIPATAILSRSHSATTSGHPAAARVSTAATNFSHAATASAQPAVIRPATAVLRLSQVSTTVGQVAAHAPPSTPANRSHAYKRHDLVIEVAEKCDAR